MASMDDVHFLEAFKSKRIKLSTKASSFTGVVQRISLNKTVVLGDVVEVGSGRKLQGSKLFFGHEILNVEFPRVPGRDTEDNSGEPRPDLAHLPVSKFQPNRFILDDGEGQHVNYVVIDELHEKFGPAVMHIKKQQVIGIGADGVGAFHHERLCWLQIATKSKVYLFDVLLLGGRAFKNGLAMILESKCILKVAHDCRCIAGCLWAQFGVNLTNVFDTQVADVMRFHAETGGLLPDRVSTLQEVVSIHLQLPLCRLSSLKIRSQLTSEDNEVWYIRPCPAPLLKVMALSVIHLQPLRLVLLDALMSDYTSLVDAYLSSSKDEPVHTQHIGKSGPELPKELRELEIIRQERQEWALNHYPVNGDGLLGRYKVKPSSEAPETQSPDYPCHGAVPPSDRDSASPETFPGHLAGTRSAQDLADFTVVEKGKQQDKESATFTIAVPAFGRGFTISAPADTSREGLLHKESVVKTSLGVEVPVSMASFSQPISLMAGVTQRGSHSPTALGRGLFNGSSMVRLPSPFSLSFTSF